MDPRSTAATVLGRVLEEGRSLSAVLAPALEGLGESDRRLAQELIYGALRWHPRLEAVARRLLRRPLKRKDCDVHALMLVGLYQLIYLSIPAHAAVAATVEAARSLGKPWAAGLLNAVLRNFQRNRSRLLGAADQRAEAALGHPAWLLEALRSTWPDDWREIAAANNKRPPMTLRVNGLKCSRAEYLERLAKAGIQGRAAPHTEHGVALNQPAGVRTLPGFAEGWVSVQDAAAQLAAPLLDAGPGMRVLDACAAPGGKTTHILERYTGLEGLIALDTDASRLARIKENLDRLGLEASVIQGDAAAPETWWDGRVFDRVLLDAPCSATGVIRRHPDIKVLRHPEDIPALARGQSAMLEALWPLVAPGGMLLYATCSVMAAENAGPITEFIQGHPDARERIIDAGWGRACTHGRQILPGEEDMDGFYYACLVKH
jgi:16S rRNA (cytosine967-C5)-methyltransferase